MDQQGLSAPPHKSSTLVVTAGIESPGSSVFDLPIQVVSSNQTIRSPPALQRPSSSQTGGNSAQANDVSLVIISGGTGGNAICSAFGNACYVLPVSDDGGSSSEIIRVLGGPSVGEYHPFELASEEKLHLTFTLSDHLPKVIFVQDWSVLFHLPPHLHLWKPFGDFYLIVCLRSATRKKQEMSGGILWKDVTYCGREFLMIGRRQSAVSVCAAF
jgi:hypothetical protein